MGVNVKKASELVGELSLMKFFPSDENARVALVRIVCEMAENEDQIGWLVRRMLNLYNEWPGPRELRACFCSKFRPADGINACSTVFLDGIPSEKASIAPQLGQGSILALPAPVDIKTCDKTQQGLNVLAQRARKMPSAREIRVRDVREWHARKLQETLTGPRDRAELPGPTPQVITPEDVVREVAKLRAKKGTELP